VGVMVWTTGDAVADDVTKAATSAGTVLSGAVQPASRAIVITRHKRKAARQGDVCVLVLMDSLYPSGLLEYLLF
jgi:zona occludens toxin (predicted ATPase)